MSSSSVSDRLDTTIEYVERIGDEVIREIEGQTGDNQPIKGYQCAHGDHIYLILSAPEWDYITIRTTFNGDEAWHAQTMEQIDFDNPHLEITQSDVQEARRELQQELEAQPDSIKRELRLNLIELLSKDGFALTLDTSNGPLNIHGFSVDKKFFVEEDNVGIQDFEQAVQTIINLGWVGGALLSENYGLRPGSSGPV